MAVSTPRSMAQCEPIPLLRDRMINDLNIKGTVTCPDKVNVESIIPVYDFADHSVETIVPKVLALNVPIVGLNIGTYRLFEFSAIPAYLWGKLINFRASLTTDAGGRAALAAAIAEIRFYLRFLQGTTYIELANQIWLVPASAGISLILEGGTDQKMVGASTARRPAANYSEFDIKAPLLFGKTTTGYVAFEWQLVGLGAMPANSFFSLSTLYSYK